MGQTTYATWASTAGAQALVDVRPMVEQAIRDMHAVTWPNGQPPLTPRGTPTLSGTVLTLVNAADRTEVQAALQATATKMDQMIAILNTAA
jgi:hypothetical protein